MAIKQGDKVSVDYEGKLEDGKIFDSSTHGDHSHPLEFVVGSGQVIKGFDDAVMGMEVGQEKEFSIEPEEAYGSYDATLVRTVPRNLMPAEPPLQEGMVFALKAPDGRNVLAAVKSVKENEVELDFNHPLAGKKLIFKIKVVAVGLGE